MSLPTELRRVDTLDELLFKGAVLARRAAWRTGSLLAAALIFALANAMGYLQGVIFLSLPRPLWLVLALGLLVPLLRAARYGLQVRRRRITRLLALADAPEKLVWIAHASGLKGPHVWVHSASRERWVLALPEPDFELLKELCRAHCPEVFISRYSRPQAEAWQQDPLAPLRWAREASRVPK